MTNTISRILVPVDFSPHASRALQYATTLATQYGARIELLHVIEDPVTSGAWSSEVYIANMPELLASLTANATRRLEELKATLPASIVADTEVIVGHPAATIPEHAQDGRFDLIVMGTHGRSGLSHLVMGSVAERVVRRAQCPVLTVREGDPGASARTAA
jgi:nucleotide-binding universal stress UspA family protein